MSTLTALVLQQGADWSERIPTTADGTAGTIPVSATGVQVVMRRDVSTLSAPLATFVELGYGLAVTGPLGLVSHPAVGLVQLDLGYDQSALVVAGTGFWDAFGWVDGHRARIASGAVVILPAITVMQPVPPVPDPDVDTLDGGDADTVYLPDQVVDGGNASS